MGHSTTLHGNNREGSYVKVKLPEFSKLNLHVSHGETMTKLRPFSYPFSMAVVFSHLLVADI